MSISQDRVTNACQHFYGDLCVEGVGPILKRVLEADDLYRATHQPAASGRDEEPELPEGVTWMDENDKNYCAQYHHNQKGNIYQRATEVNFTASDLRAIALHMDWRDRQRTLEQEAPVVTDAMAQAAVEVYGLRAWWLPPCDSPIDHREIMRRAIAAALEAQRSEARKQV